MPGYITGTTEKYYKMSGYITGATAYFDQQSGYYTRTTQITFLKVLVMLQGQKVK